MACPHVAGVLALLRGQKSGMGATQAETAMKASALAGKISYLQTGSPDKLLHITSNTIANNTIMTTATTKATTNATTKATTKATTTTTTKATTTTTKEREKR